jgi:NAD(P)-dependent dehydrogenase (short-subunit alcohol dehydrogenase family)
MNKKFIMVTGVSSGIGQGTLSYFVKKGFHVYGSVRSSKDANKLKKIYKENFTPLIFDVTKEAQMKKAASIVKKDLKSSNLLALVNNAGVAISGPLLMQNIKDFEKQIDINLNGAFRVLKFFAPLCGAEKNNNSKKGVIFNISSISGKIGMPGVGAYTASKFGLEGLSHSLRRELISYGVDVVIIGPGPIKSKIFDKIDKKFLDSLKKTDYAKAAKGIPKRMKNAKKIAFPAEEVGKLIFNALHDPNRKTRYTITPNKLMYWTLPMFISDRMLDRMIGKRSGL